MKIDFLHKPTEYMETVIILQEENGDIEKLEYLPEYLQNAIKIVVKRTTFSSNMPDLRASLLFVPENEPMLSSAVLVILRNWIMTVFAILLLSQYVKP